MASKKARKKKRAPAPMRLVFDTETRATIRRLQQQMDALKNLEMMLYRIESVCIRLAGILGEVNDVPRLLREIAEMRGLPKDPSKHEKTDT